MMNKKVWIVFYSGHECDGYDQTYWVPRLITFDEDKARELFKQKVDSYKEQYKKELEQEKDKEDPMFAIWDDEPEYFQIYTGKWAYEWKIESFPFDEEITKWW